MSASQEARQQPDEDPIAMIADGINVWIGKLGDIVHTIVDRTPIRHVINWGRIYSLWPVNITTACCSPEFGAASGARQVMERVGVMNLCYLGQSAIMVT